MNSQEPVQIRCKEHGVFLQSPTRHLAGRGCQKCGGSKLQTTEELIQRASAVHAGKYDYSMVPNTAKGADEVQIICPEHGVFVQRLKYHTARKYGCIRCGQRSKPEDCIAEFLSQYTRVERRNRKILAPKEVDIWLPEHRIAIEHHRLYWHSQERVGNLHREKWEMATKLGVRLIQIFEDEWLKRRQVVEGRLLALIGECESYNARKLTLRNAPNADARALLDLTHTQGVGSATPISIGLYEGGTLVALGVFGQARVGAVAPIGDNGWEVLRYASLGRVRGGFGKILKAFERETHPDYVVSYCDLRYGDGSLYAATGFTLESITAPDYWWADLKTTTRIPRYATQKIKLAKPNHPLHKWYSPDRTEREICEAAGLKKILGVGNQKWVKRY